MCVCVCFHSLPQLRILFELWNRKLHNSLILLFPHYTSETWESERSTYAFNCTSWQHLPNQRPWIYCVFSKTFQSVYFPNKFLKRFTPPSVGSRQTRPGRRPHCRCSRVCLDNRNTSGIWDFWLEHHSRSFTSLLWINHHHSFQKPTFASNRESRHVLSWNLNLSGKKCFMIHSCFVRQSRFYPQTIGSSHLALI